MNLILLLVIPACLSYPLPEGQTRRRPDPFGIPLLTAGCDQKCKTYLLKHGYLDGETPHHINSIMTESTMLGIGLKHLQREAGLEESGILTNETAELFDLPRCGVRFVQRQKRFATVQKWSTLKNERNETVVSWSIDLTNLNKINTNLSDDTIRSIFSNALSKWSNTSLLHFKELVPNPSRVGRSLPEGQRASNISIKFAAKNHGDPYPFDGPGNVLGHAYYPGTSLEGQVHLDLDETWSLYDDFTSMYHVALHELGHAIGLAHSSQSEAIMYAWYQNPKYNLADDDTWAVNALYGVKPQYKFGPIAPAHKPARKPTHKPTHNYYGLKNLKLLIKNSKIFIYPKSSSLSFN